MTLDLFYFHLIVLLSSCIRIYVIVSCIRIYVPFIFVHGLFAPIVLIGLIAYVSAFIAVMVCECHIQLKGYFT